MKTIVKIVLIFALLGVGCGYQLPIAGEGYDGPTNPQPGQDVAIKLVWEQAYGMDYMEPPPILWHFGDNCTDYQGNHGPEYGTPAAFRSAHVTDCVYGQYESSGWVTTTEYDAPNRIDLEWNGSISFMQGIAHELCHAFKQYTTGDGDENHTSDCFVGTDGLPYGHVAGAAPGSRVYEANQAVIAAGL